MKTHKVLTFIDLFSGLGSFRQGFESVGAKCVFSLDFDPKVAQAYQYAYDDDCEGDILELEPSDLPKFDVLCGGFPCQPFSTGGKRLGFKDSRAQPVYKLISLLKDTQPSAFVLENVKGISTFNKGLGDSPLNVIKGWLEDCGYDVYTLTLNAYTHGGLPQNRERVFFVGYHSDLEVQTPQELAPIKCSKSFKSYLEAKSKIDTKHFYSQSSRPKLAWVFKELEAYMQSPNFEDFVYQIRNSSHNVRKHTVKGRSPALIKRMGTGGNNVPLIYDTRLETWRKFTPRECLNLQGFDPKFPLDPSLPDSAYYGMAGNSIPVNLSKRIAELVLKSLR